MYTCHSNRAKCRCGMKAWAQPLRSLPPCTYIPQNTHMASSAPLLSPVCGCFSAYTYVSALRRYQACLMQWTCISISAGQTQINRNVLKKNVSNKFLCKSGREREGVQQTNEPISLVWKWTKTFLMQTPRPGRGGRSAWMLIHFLVFFRLWASHANIVTWGKVIKVSKGKPAKFYFNPKSGNSGVNLNSGFTPSICANEGDIQNEMLTLSPSLFFSF